MDTLNLLFPIAIVAVFYFFIMRPQAKRQKSQEKFVKELQKGDQVVTASGVLGKISKVDDGIVTLVVDNKTSLQVTKTAISREMTEAVYGSKKEKVKS